MLFFKEKITAKCFKKNNNYIRHKKDKAKETIFVSGFVCCKNAMFAIMSKNKKKLQTI
jgi:hypothetical protein